MTHSPLRIMAPFLAPFLLAAALAAGCGAGARPDPDADLQINACALFSAEDAQAVAGDTLAVMSSTMEDARGHNPFECIYNTGTLEQPRILSLLVRRNRNADAAKALQGSSRAPLAAMAGGKVMDVPGLGDGALWFGGKLQQLHVLAGSRQLVVTVQSPDGSDQLATARQIASRAVARLRAALAALHGNSGKPGPPGNPAKPRG